MCSYSKMPRAVIFDMDGVLFDTESIALKSWYICADEYGIKDVDSIYMQCIGSDGAHAVLVLHETMGEDFPAEKFLIHTRKINQKIREEEGIPVKEGAEDLLRWLEAKQEKIALASSTHRSDVEKMLKRAGLYSCFSVILCGDMVTHTKPDPEIFVKTMEALGENPKDCLVIEDSYNGIRAASCSGARVVMVPDLLPPNREMEEKSELIVQNLTMVKKYLES